MMAIFTEKRIMALAEELIGPIKFLIAQRQMASEQEIIRRLTDPTTKLNELEIAAESLHLFIAYLTLGLEITSNFSGINSQMSFKDLADYLNASCGHDPFIRPVIIGPAVF